MPTAAETVRQACQVIWSEGRVDRVPEFYAQDFRADYPMTDWGTGVAGVAALAASVRDDLPGYAEHIDELIEAGDEVVVRLTITGTNPKTGESVSFRDVTLLTVRDGKICFQRGLTDYLSLYLQLGLVQMPAA
jgi:ketosteroid isomerase-like protein